MLEVVNLDKLPRDPKLAQTGGGDQPKWLIGKKWYKADYLGYEGLAECLISWLMRYSNVTDYVEYEPCLIRSGTRARTGCVCQNFRWNDEMLISFERLHRAYQGRGLADTLAAKKTAAERIKYTVAFTEEATGLKDIGRYLTLLLELDAFFLNEDRNTGNLAVLRNELDKRYRLCPIFDNGMALLADTRRYPADEDVESCIADTEARPFDSSFDVQMEAAERLYGRQLHFNFNINDVREYLGTALEGSYDLQITDRVEQIISRQMRRYRRFF